jgi:hypothetical protein
MPARSAYRRSILTHREWNVLICEPGKVPRARVLWRISSAALLVKVIAQILCGLMPESIRDAIRYVMTAVFPLPGPAMTSKGPSMWQMAFLWEGVSGILNFELLLFNCYSVKSTASAVNSKHCVLNGVSAFWLLLLLLFVQYLFLLHQFLEEVGPFNLYTSEEIAS